MSTAAVTAITSGQLPHGRHKLSREFVTHSQRERLLRSVLDAVARVGYHETGIGEIIRGAAVSRKTLYQHFASKEQLFLTALAAEMAEARAVMPSRRDLAGGIRAFLQHFAARPAAARACIVEAAAASATVRSARDAELLGLGIFGGLPDQRAYVAIGATTSLVAACLTHGDGDLDELEHELVPMLQFLRRRGSA